MTHVVGLRLRNWMCFRGEHVLELGRGVYGVVAQGARDADRSNGLGKSMLLGAIRYALEGHKPRHFTSLDQMISEGEREMVVDVELSDGTFVSRVKARGSSTDLVVELPEYDPQFDDARPLELRGDEAERAIWKRLGLTAEDLEATAYAEQKQLAALVRPGAKRNIADAISGWLNLAPLEGAGDEAGRELRALSDELRSCEKELAAVDMRIAQYGDERATLQRMNELAEELRSHELRVARNRERVEAKALWGVQRAARTQAVVLIVEALAALAGVASAPKLGDAGEGERLRQDLDEARWRRDTCHTDIAQKRSLVAGQFDGSCPVNGRSCPVQSEINDDRRKSKALLDQARARLDAAENEVRAADFSWREWAAKRDEHRRLSERLRAARERLEGIQHLPLMFPLEPEPSIEAVVEGASPQAELEDLRRKERQQMQDRQEHARLAALLQALKAKVAAARAAYAVLDRAPRLVAERAVRQIEAATNHDLSLAGIDLRLSFAWERETKSPADVCPKCGTAFPRSAAVKQCSACLAPRGLKATYDPRFRLSRVSGAYEDLGGLALRCAAFQWLRRRRGASWSVAVLDEPFAALDRYHERALAAHVQRLLEHTFDQAFVVAHDRHTLDSLPRRIMITGDGRWSSAKVVE